MFSFTSGWAFWYAWAAGTRVESTQTVSGPEVCGAWLKPSFVGLADEEDDPPPHAAIATATTAARPAAAKARRRDGPVVLSTRLVLVHRRHGSSIARVEETAAIRMPGQWTV